eukprot:365626-Chlamydomonas_euryale.AAC.4
MERGQLLVRTAGFHTCDVWPACDWRGGAWQRLAASTAGRLPAAVHDGMDTRCGKLGRARAMDRPGRAALPIHPSVCLSIHPSTHPSSMHEPYIYLYR